jgi:NAD(P)-dependent dehydrogenase (short-subunit alcohol dehydrogenase family)
MLLSSLVWLFAGGLKRNEARTPNSSHFVWSSFVRSQKPVINHRGSPIIVPTEDAEKELEQRVSQSIPLGRFSDADDVAKAVLYLASDDSAIVSGTEIVVDGGATGSPLGAPIYRHG